MTAINNKHNVRFVILLSMQRKVALKYTKSMEQSFGISSNTKHTHRIKVIAKKGKDEEKRARLEEKRIDDKTMSLTINRCPTFTTA